MSNEQIGQMAAEEFRRQHSLGMGPIADIAALIEYTTGVGVAYVNGAAPGHGMTMSLGQQTLMGVGCTDHPMRLRSTLAHELGHLQLDTVNRVTNSREWDARTPEEIQADAFARHLLVPEGAVIQASKGKDRTLGLLSNMVRYFGASPAMVAIQLRKTGIINAERCQEWSQTTSTRSLALRFGWHREYEQLVEESRTPRAPQPLHARAIEAYRWGMISPAAIARLSGEPNIRTIVELLGKEEIIPQEVPLPATEKPADSGDRLSAAEIDKLAGRAD